MCHTYKHTYNTVSALGRVRLIFARCCPNFYCHSMRSTRGDACTHRTPLTSPLAPFDNSQYKPDAQFLREFISYSCFRFDRSIIAVRPRARFDRPGIMGIFSASIGNMIAFPQHFDSISVTPSQLSYCFEYRLLMFSILLFPIVLRQSRCQMVRSRWSNKIFLVSIGNMIFSSQHFASTSVTRSQLSYCFEQKTTAILYTAKAKQVPNGSIALE